MSNLIEFAKREIERAGDPGEGVYPPGAIAESVLQLLKVFEEQEHSGMSAAIVLSLFERAVRFRPLSPLTGADDEWVLAFDGTYQNKRCPSVFKDATRAWDIDARVWEYPDGVRVVRGGADAAKTVTFPYLPPSKAEIIKVDADGNEVH